MHITWHGLACCKIQTQNATVVINPFQDSVGIKMPKLKVDIVTSTNMTDDTCNNIERLQGEVVEITCPGEYDVKEIFIYGTALNSTETAYVIEAEGITVGHVGTRAASLTNEQLSVFERVDVLFLPISNSTSAERSELISQIEPRVIIPIHYKTAGVKLPLDTLDAFAKEMGVSQSNSEKKIILKAKDLPVEETIVQVLQVV